MGFIWVQWEKKLVVEVLQFELSTQKIMQHYNKMRMLRAAQNRLQLACPVIKQFVPLEQLIKEGRI